MTANVIINEAFWDSVVAENHEQTKRFLEEGALEDIIINEGLTIACFRKLLTSIRLLIAHGAQPEKTSVLFNAIFTPDGISCLECMIDRIKLTQTTWYHWTSAHLAVTMADLEVVKKLFKLEENICAKKNARKRLIHARTDLGESVLHLAAAHSTVDVLRFLLTQGVIMEGRTKNGSTALHYGAKAGKMENVRCLFHAGIDCSLVTDDGQKPSDFAIKNNHTDIASFIRQHELTTRNLIRIDRTHVRRQVRTPVRTPPARHPINPSEPSGSMDMVDGHHSHPPEETTFCAESDDVSRTVALPMSQSVREQQISRRLSPSSEDHEVKRLIRATTIAVNEHDTDSFKLYIRRGVSRHFLAHTGQALLSSCLSSMPCFATLLEFGGDDINSRDSKGKTTLHYACAIGHEMACIQLLEEGADVNIIDTKGCTPLHTAIFNSLTAFQNPQKCREYRNIVTMLVERGCSVNATDHQKSSPAYLAVVANNVDILEILIQNGSDANTLSRYNMTPLAEACNRGHVTITRALVNWGIDVNAHDRIMRRSAFSIALQRGHLLICDLLIKAGTKLESESWMYNVYSLGTWFQGRRELGEQTWDYIVRLTTQGLSLKEACRRTIYSRIRIQKDHSVAHLPLPEMLRDFILSKEVHCTFKSSNDH